jgi:myo-inositol-1(or 4)-monophosphatase
MTQPHAGELEKWLAAAEEAALKAGEVLTRWRGNFRVQEKGRSDLVTDADLAAQQCVRELLTSRFPTHGFLGEEEKTPSARPAKDSPPTWIIDPLDGTTNYVHDFPMYCVSIGLQVEGEMVVGVVYDPTRNELFRAAHGQGAWLNERRLKTSETPTLDQALLTTGFPPDMRGQERQLNWWRFFSLHAQSVRRTGSTALNLAYLAAGRFDGFWAFDNHVWDVAAGVVLLRESGGTISAIDGSKYDPFAPAALASNGPLHAALLEAFRTGP